MAKEQPVSLVGTAREQYLNRLHTRMEFLHDFVSGKEDGCGIEGKELKKFVEHLHRAWSVVATTEVKQVFDRRQQLRVTGETVLQSGNVIPFRPRLD